MGNSWVRSIGRVEDLDGYPVAVGVDYDAETIGVCKLDAGMQEEFAQLFVSAVWQAGQNRAAMQDEGAAGRPHPAVESGDADSGGEPAAGATGAGAPAAGHFGMTDAEFERRLRMLMRVNPALLEGFFRQAARRHGARPWIRG